MSTPIDDLYPPSKYRLRCVSRGEMRAMVRYAEEGRPLFYNGRRIELKHEKVGTSGLFRVWLEEDAG